MEHFGKVTAYSDGAYIVEVSLRSDECGGCSAALFCGSSNGSTIPLRASADGNHDASLIGRRVKIQTAEQDRLKAISLLLLLPLAVFLLVAVGLGSVGVGDLIAGLSAILSALAIYLILFFLQRNKRLQWVIIEIL